MKKDVNVIASAFSSDAAPPEPSSPCALTTTLKHLYRIKLGYDLSV
jgi:hypothetical protein